MRNISIKNYWNQVSTGYSLYWQSYAKQQINVKELKFINKFFRMTNKKKVLDVGIGNGRIIDNYLGDSRCTNIYGLDIAHNMVKYCQKKYKNEIRVKNLRMCNISNSNIPYKMRFNFITVIRVLKYNANWRHILKRTLKFLSQDGILVFTIPNTIALRRFSPSETPMHTATKSEIENLCNNLNVQILGLTTFSRLPDIFYDISNNKMYTKIILLLEKILEKFLGPHVLGKIFFLAVKKV